MVSAQGCARSCLMDLAIDSRLRWDMYLGWLCFKGTAYCGFVQNPGGPDEAQLLIFCLCDAQAYGSSRPQPLVAQRVSALARPRVQGGWGLWDHAAAQGICMKFVELWSACFQGHDGAFEALEHSLLFTVVRRGPCRFPHGMKQAQMLGEAFALIHTMH
jgi:hypothetical protein